ncbi:lytic polysaccharide monooxygenase auxiliary activity family 9 protein [Amycolatopsis anabasis]|uniref:lytic polysaccharide monooxygenase auxiliary activity family 9 protein n=1 Tax=Amycolatopsis anabasis TaxID=1840409 RepID=UPI00131BA71B|nr:lytic polysaccharide monooxygenase [Amycolatopsis anabasis]
MRKRLVAAMIAGLVLPFVCTGTATGHGYTANPPSRSYHCKTGAVKNCGPIQWEPQSVEGPKGFPARGPADGKICSAGLSQFKQLDDPRGGTWPAKSLTSGARFEFTWTLTAAHATTSFRYFVTRDGWNPAAPLTRAQLEATPFLTVPFNGQRPPNTVKHSGTLPAGKSGRHLILAVWDIADTGNAFYSCDDVQF